jgi:hypothetical protein
MSLNFSGLGGEKSSSLGRITTERSLVGRQPTEIQGVRSPLSYKTAIQMTFAMPKLRRLKSGGYWRVNAFEKPMRGANLTRNVPPDCLAAKRLHRRSPKGHRRSLRAIARELQTTGYSNKRGSPYSASCVKSMVEGPSPVQLTHR